jgi:hypothetical protein
MATQPTADDLAYVRRLAERGAHAPFLGGRFMAWWGLLVMLAWTAQHFALRGALGQSGLVFAWIWLGFGIAGPLGQFALARSMPAKPGEGSAGNRAARSVWTAAAFAILSVALGANFAAVKGAGWGVMDWLVAVSFSVYACALVVTGALGANRTLLAAGAGAIAMAGLFTALILHPDRYLLAALGAALTVLLPGLLLLRAEPRGESGAG